MTREYFRELAESFLAHTRRLPEDSYQIPPMAPVDLTTGQNPRRSSRLQINPMQSRSRQRGTTDFRRNIYAQDLWVQDLVDISGRYRECTPQFYRDNPAQIHRIIPWLNREVNVLLSDCESHAAYVLSRIVSTLTQHSIRSREFRELVQPYFGDRTDHFIHELYTFAHSVYDIAGFDQHAVYGTNPNYATEVQEISSSNDDSDIEVLETFEKKDKTSKKFSKQGFKKILLKKVEGGKSDEPVAGPSGIASTSTPDSVEICESDNDEIKVLEYVKPEPEVVTLSSGEESRISPGCDTNVERTEMRNCKTRKKDFSSLDEQGTDKRSRRRSGKGKCKSNGFGLKGGQKKKYICLKNRSSSSSSTSSSSSCRSSSISSSSSSQTRSHSRKTTRSRSHSTGSSSSSDYKPSKLKKKKSKVSRKKYKKKINSKYLSGNKSEKSSGSVNVEPERLPIKKIRVKSCVIVPGGKSRDSSPPRSFSSNSSRDSDKGKYRRGSRSLATYWSIVSSPTGEDKPRKKSDSSERKLGKSKRRGSGGETSSKRPRDSGSSSERCRDAESSSSSRKQKFLRESAKSNHDSSTESLSEEGFAASGLGSASTSSASSKYSLPTKPNSASSYIDSD